MADCSAEQLVLVFRWGPWRFGGGGFFVYFPAVLTVKLGAFEVFSHCSALLLSLF